MNKLMNQNILIACGIENERMDAIMHATCHEIVDFMQKNISKGVLGISSAVAVVCLDKIAKKFALNSTEISVAMLCLEANLNKVGTGFPYLMTSQIEKYEEHSAMQDLFARLFDDSDSGRAM